MRRADGKPKPRKIGVTPTGKKRRKFVEGNDISERMIKRRGLADDPVVFEQSTVDVFNRSRVTNGSVLIPGVDHRMPWARRLRDLIEGSIADLGGLENMSNIERALVSRASWLLLQLEQIEAKVGKDRDGVASPRQLREYGTALACLRRTLESLHGKDNNFGRRAKDAITPVTPRELQRMLAQ